MSDKKASTPNYRYLIFCLLLIPHLPHTVFFYIHTPNFFELPPFFRFSFLIESLRNLFFGCIHSFPIAFLLHPFRSQFRIIQPIESLPTVLTLQTSIVLSLCILSFGHSSLSNPLRNFYSCNVSYTILFSLCFVLLSNTSSNPVRILF